jgi:hypothetical protein
MMILPDGCLLVKEEEKHLEKWWQRIPEEENKK